MTEYKDYKSILKQEIDENKYTAGANILVIQDGREVLYEEYGFRDIKNKAAFSRDTIMRLYSMSKPITSAAMDHNGAQGTEAVATSLNHGHLVGQSLLFQFFFQSFHNFLASGGGTSCSAADKYM